MADTSAPNSAKSCSCPADYTDGYGPDRKHNAWCNLVLSLGEGAASWKDAGSYSIREFFPDDPVQGP